MAEKFNVLQERLLATCVGHDFPTIMAALTLVTGAMIGMHAPSPDVARDMGKAAGTAILQGVKLYHDKPEVH
jgi:hypothetical protein